MSKLDDCVSNMEARKHGSITLAKSCVPCWRSGRRSGVSELDPQSAQHALVYTSMTQSRDQPPTAGMICTQRATRAFTHKAATTREPGCRPAPE